MQDDFNGNVAMFHKITKSQNDAVCTLVVGWSSYMTASMFIIDLRSTLFYTYMHRKSSYVTIRRVKSYEPYNNCVEDRYYSPTAKRLKMIKKITWLTANKISSTTFLSRAYFFHFVIF